MDPFAILLQNHKEIPAGLLDDLADELPWLEGPCEWTPKLIRKAVVWLCGRVGKPILKLTYKDYADNSLGDLVAQKGPYDQINIDG